MRGSQVSNVYAVAHKFNPALRNKNTYKKGVIGLVQTLMCPFNFLMVEWLRRITLHSTVRTRRTRYTLMHLYRYTSCMLLYALLNGVPESLYRLIPRIQREVRRGFVPWEELLLKGQRGRKYVPKSEIVDIFILTLERATERKGVTARSLQLQKLDYEQRRAVDGLKPLEYRYVNEYAGPKKRKRLLSTSYLSHSELLQMNTKYISGELKDQTLRSLLHERLRFGCYMTHVLLWEHMLHRRLDFIIVFEDDVILTTDFAVKIRNIIIQLPQNWGILYLNGTERKFGGKHSDGIFQSRGGVGAFAYAISREAVEYFLSGPARKSDKPVDHVMNEAVLSGRVLAYHAKPELASLVLNMRSTLAYK